MQAFSKCRYYDDYIKIIYEAIKSGTSYQKDNKDGIEKLLKVEEKNKKKILQIMKLIDQEFSFNGSKSNEMFKKIDYLLVLGYFENDYKEIFEKLPVEELYTLIIGEYSSINDYNKDLLPIFSKEQLLKVIRLDNQKKKEEHNTNLFDVSDYFFMIRQHYEKEKFDLNDQNKVNEFIYRMICKIHDNKLHDGVKNMLEFWNSEELEEIKRKLSN